LFINQNLNGSYCQKQPFTRLQKSRYEGLKTANSSQLRWRKLKLCCRSEDVRLRQGAEDHDTLNSLQQLKCEKGPRTSVQQASRRAANRRLRELIDAKARLRAGSVC